MNNLIKNRIYESNYSKKRRGTFVQENYNTEDNTFKNTLYNIPRYETVDFWELNFLHEREERKIGGEIKIKKSTMLKFTVKVMITYEHF